MRLGLPADAPAPALSFGSQMACGCFAGAVQILATYPLDLARTRLQLSEVVGARYRGIFHCLSLTVQREGAGALYKGLLPSLAAGVPYVGLQMSFYSQLKALPVWRRRADGSLTVGSMLAAGSLAGIASQTISYPLDTVRHRMQADGLGGAARVYSGARNCIRMSAPGCMQGKGGLARSHLLMRPSCLPAPPLFLAAVLLKEGARGFFRGWLLNTARALPGAATQFCVYDSLKRLLGA